jgi:hypothetical protein
MRPGWGCARRCVRRSDASPSPPGSTSWRSSLDEALEAVRRGLHRDAGSTVRAEQAGAARTERRPRAALAEAPPRPRLVLAEPVG